jgi:hypothetical protein
LASRIDGSIAAPYTLAVVEMFACRIKSFWMPSGVPLSLSDAR